MMQSTIVHATITDNQIGDKAKVWTIKFTQEVVLDEANKVVQVLHFKIRI